MPTMPLPTNDEVDDARVRAADDILTSRHGGLTDGSTPIRASITCSSCGATHSYSVLRDGTAEAHALEWGARFDRESAQRKTKRLKLRRLSFIFISDEFPPAIADPAWMKRAVFSATRRHGNVVAASAQRSVLPWCV